MSIAPQGLPFVLAGLALACLGCPLFKGPAGWALSSVGLAFACFCAYFFRDPDRPAPSDRSLVYSPGDGRVLSVAREGPGDVVTVRVFLSILDVHVQRLPCWGRVESVRHQSGAFRMAMLPESRYNERTLVRIAAEGGGAVGVEQIAGFVARRIICWTKEGERAEAGARYGLIRFGSQVALHLPASVEILVRPGDRVVGGVSPVARWTPSA